MIESLLVLGVSFFTQVPADSLGTQIIDGKVMVIHKVDEKETLYAISRRYGTTVEAILQYNPTAGAGLEIGQIVKVPFTPKKERVVQEGGIHKVAEKETLYSISRVYGVSVDEIRLWNGLTSNALSLGQELVIKRMNTITTSGTVVQANQEVILEKGKHQVAQQETMFSISRKYGISIDDLRRWNNLDGNELKIGQILTVVSPGSSVTVAEQMPSKEIVKQETTKPADSPPPARETTEPGKITISEAVKDGDEVVQAGLAELIGGTEGNRKYLALHRTAPVGTIIKVRNEMNNREVFVRVMGKLPETAMTDKLIIKISKSAYDRLGAIDPRFRVELTYYK